MNALIRKDKAWLILMAILGTVTLTICYANERFERIWMFPVDGGELIYALHLSVGFSLAFGTALFDEFFGTRDYLRHRPVSPRQIHTAQLLGSAIVLGIWMVIPSLLHWGTEIVFGEHGAFLQLSNAPDVWLLTLPMFSAFAMTLYCASLPCFWLWRAVALTAGTLLLMTGGTFLSEAGAQNSRFAWLAFHVGMTGMFLWAWYGNAAAAADRDRPWSPAIRRNATVAILTITWGATLGIAALQEQTLDALDDERPRVVWAEDDPTPQLAYRVRVSDNRYETFRANEDHTVSDRVMPQAMTLWRASSAGGGNYGFDLPKFNSGSWRRTEVYEATVDSDAGEVRVAWRDATWWVFEAFETVGKADGSKFSAEARILDAAPGTNAVWICDDDRLWRLRRDEPERQFEQVELPDGDRIEQVRRLRVRDDAPDTILAMLDNDRTTLVVGARGRYHLTDEIEPAPADLLRAEAKRGAAPPFRAETLDRDPLRPVVRVENTDGESLLEHSFEPRTSTEHLFATATLAVSLLRPPCLQAASWLFADETSKLARQPLLDPLCADQRRSWLVLATFAFSLLCAFGLSRRLQRRHVDAATRRHWCALTAVLGPAAALAALAVETRRAHARPIGFGPTPRPRILSA